MQEIRYVLRSLVSARWFTVAAVLTFAIGIGLNLAVFSVVDRMLFRPLPYRNLDRMVLLRACGQSGFCGGAFPSIIAFEARERLTTVDGIALAAMTEAVGVPDDPDVPPLRLHAVSANLLRVLGVQPVVGRDFTDDDASEKRRVALISHETWTRRFSAASDVIGRTFGSGGQAVTIVGILPPEFVPPSWAFPDPRWDGLVLGSTGWVQIEPTGSITVPVARLAPGSTLAAARAEVDALVRALEPQLRSPEGRIPIVRVDPVGDVLFSRFAGNAWLITAAAVVLLLLACANLATLLVARGRSRDAVIAIHASLGASPRRLIGLAIAESVIICGAGAAVALAAQAALSKALLSVVPPLFARYAVGAGDMRVLAVALATALVCALAVGLLPAMRAMRVDVLSTLQRAHGSSRSRRRGPRSLLVVEAALSVMLVLSALVIVRSLTRLTSVDLGFDPDGLYAVSFNATTPGRPTAPEARLEAYRQMMSALRGMPGVRAVAGADSPVAAGMGAMRPFTTDDSIPGGRYQVSSDYFDTIGTRFVAGRPFTEAEVHGRAPIAILNASAVRTLFPAEAPAAVIGRPIVVQDEAPRTVVGVIPDLRNRHFVATEPALYLPLGAEPSNYPAAVVRMESGTPRPSLSAIQQRLTIALGRTGRPWADSMADGVDSGLQDPRFRTVVFTVLASAALLLAAVGLYAVASFDVAMRRYEMGVRLALGAGRGQVRRLIVSEACRPILLGIAIGLTGAYWSEALLADYVYRGQPRDPWVYASVAGILLGTAVLASWVPAHRASRVAPAEMLRVQ